MAQSNASQPVRWHRIWGLLLLALLIIELVSQVFVYRWAGERFKTFEKYHWSAYGLVRNNPELTSPEFKINANGFRNSRTFTREKPANTLRVLMLGGSVLYSGLGRVWMEGVQRVDSDSTIAQFLERDLRNDPALAGLNIEVINAAVNYNTIVEVSTAYITEYAFWSPDVVIVCGSANNFGYMARRGQISERTFIIQQPHAWRSEFERIANRRSLGSLAERAVLTLENHFASVAVAKKGTVKALDKAIELDGRFAFTNRAAAPDQVASAAPASWDEYDQYVSEYEGYADAIIAVAKRHDQETAFFWEYFLGHMGGIKPLSEVEKKLYLPNRLPSYELDRQFDFHARDKLAEYFPSRGVAFIDPLDELKQYQGTVFIDYLHYTKEGNEFMAKVMFDQMQDVFHTRAKRVQVEGQNASSVRNLH
jgi:hypothetical protein